LWNDTYFVSILSVGVVLLPLALLVVFFDLPFVQALTAYVLLMAFVKILLLYKAYRIFFSSFSGSLHVILYFCALEIVPLLFAWGLLETITHHGMLLL
jgi:putative membrane protein